MERNETKEMIDFYLEKELTVHIKLASGKFYNGQIVEWETDSVIVFNDRVLGLIHIFISQINVIEEYEVRG